MRQKPPSATMRHESELFLATLQGWGVGQRRVPVHPHTDEGGNCTPNLCQAQWLIIGQVVKAVIKGFPTQSQFLRKKMFPNSSTGIERLARRKQTYRRVSVWGTKNCQLWVRQSRRGQHYPMCHLSIQQRKQELERVMGSGEWSLLLCRSLFNL